MSPFCKVCGMLLKMNGSAWSCPKDHDESLVDKVVQSDEGIRVLIPKANSTEDFWKNFWKYACNHGTAVYVLKVENRKPKYNLHITGNDPCARCICLQKPEGYQLKSPLPKDFEMDDYEQG